jgi:hypothetical protein
VYGLVKSPLLPVNGEPVPLTIKRVYPQVQNGQFRVDLDFQGRARPASSRVRLPKVVCSSAAIRKGPSSLLGPSSNARAGIGSLFSDPGATLLSAVASSGSSYE